MPRRHPPRPFDPAVARRLLRRLRRGEMLRDLWRDPSFPGRFTLKRWRAEEPEFSRAVRAAVNAARSRRYFAKSPYDHAALKAEICARLQAGEPLRRIMQDAHMPHMWTIRRLLALDADFAWDLAVARELMLDGKATWIPRDTRRRDAPPPVLVVHDKLDFRLMPQRYGVAMQIAERRARRAARDAAVLADYAASVADFIRITLEREALDRLPPLPPSPPKRGRGPG